MNDKTFASHRRHRQLGRSHRFAVGLLASAGMAAVLLAALYLSAPHAHTRLADPAVRAEADAVQHALLSSGTGTSAAAGPATRGVGSATFHEDADLRQLAPEPDPSAAAVAAY